MSQERIKRSLGFVTDKKVGDLDIMERRTPKGYNLIEVYADTETGYQTHGIKPGEYIGKPHVAAVMSEMSVGPCIISWQYRRRHLKKDRTDTYEAGGYIRKTKLIRFLDDFEEFLIDLAYIYNEWKLTPVVYFHNSSYDIPVIEPLLRELDPDIVLYTYVKPNDKGFIRGCFESPKYNVFWEFGDTLQYDRTLSIDKAGEILGKPKIKGIPYGLCDLLVNDNVMEYYDLQTGLQRTFPLDKYLEYAERDVDIMRELNERRAKSMNLINSIMVEDWEKMNQKQFNKWCLTIPGHSKKIANTYLKRMGGTDVDTTFRYNLKETIIGDYKPLYQQISESNCGGFTSFNRHISKYDCRKDEHILYYDRNSMYPTIMTDYLPYGDLLDEKPSEPHVTGYSIKITHISGKGVMSCLNNDPFGQAKSNGLPFFVLKDYFDFILENSDMEYKIFKTYYQLKTKVLAPLIQKFYERRKELNKAKKELEKNGEKGTPKYEDIDDKQKGLKLLMNALYGKMCEKGHLLSCVYSDGEYHTFESETEYYPCILTGSYITYMGRISLLTKIKEVLDAGYTFLYADTDSVVLACPRHADLTKIFGTDAGNLGEWKLEKGYDLFFNVGARKKYALFNREISDHKLALSGIPRWVQEILEDKIKDNFEQGIRDISIMFNPKKNMLLKNSKVHKILSQTGGQQILYNGDFQMNKKLGRITHTMYIDHEGYRVEKCEG